MTHTILKGPAECFLIGLWALTFPEVESWGWHFASQHCSSPCEPCSPLVRYRSAQLPPPRRYSSPWWNRLASSLLLEDLSQIYRLQWVLLISLKICCCIWDEAVYSVMLQLAVCPGSLSLFVLSLSGLRSVHDFYRCSVAISDPSCHSTISVHWHLTPSAPCLIPWELEAQTLRRG